MSVSFELHAEPRNDMGKGASRRLRREGKVPAIMYGGGKDPQALTLEQRELLHNLENEAFFSHILTIKVDGSDEQAVLRDLQRHPSKPVVLHVDLQRVSASEKIHVRVPLHFVGEDVAVGVKMGGGMISHELTEVDVECLPGDLPEFIEVDVSGLDVGDSLHLSDLKLPAGVTLVELARGEGHDLSVVSVHARRGGGEEEAAEGEGGPAAEGEGEGES